VASLAFCTCVVHNGILYISTSSHMVTSRLYFDIEPFLENHKFCLVLNTCVCHLHAYILVSVFLLAAVFLLASITNPT